MTKKTQKNAIIKKITVATIVAIFSLMSAFTGTVAWFMTNREVAVTGASFKVQTPGGISYEIYELHNFTDKDGNYSETVEEYIGYENASTTAEFSKITFDESGVPEQDPNPVDISHLWPAHRLTYALVVGGSFSAFKLETWSEVTLDTAMVDAETHVSLSWAINIFGGAYYVTKTNAYQDEEDNILADISTGYNTYEADANVEDVFTYSESGEDDPEGAIQVVNSISGASGDNKRIILYFSIEFSNDSDTFYKYNKETNYYAKNIYGNSNCYKGLSLTDLVFKLV